MSPFLKKSFDPSKCKTLLQLNVQRIKLLRNKKSIANKKLRADIAKFLEKGQDSKARLQVETLIREDDLITVYDLLEQYCEIVINQLPAMKLQKLCPSDLKEAVTSLIYAAPFCKDLLELQKLKKIFKSKYGTEFSLAAIDLRPDCGVNAQVIQKLCTVHPKPDTKLKLLKEIAQEYKIDWQDGNEISDVETISQASEGAGDTLEPISMSHLAPEADTASGNLLVTGPTTVIVTAEAKTVLEHNQDLVKNDVSNKKLQSTNQEEVASHNLNGGNIKVSEYEILDLKTATEIAYVSASQAAEAAKAALNMICMNSGWNMESSNLDKIKDKIDDVMEVRRRSCEAENGPDYGVFNGADDMHSMSDERLEQIERCARRDKFKFIDFNDDSISEKVPAYDSTEVSDKAVHDTGPDSSIYVVSEVSIDNTQKEIKETARNNAMGDYEEQHIAQSDPEMPQFDDYESESSFEEETHVISNDESSHPDDDFGHISETASGLDHLDHNVINYSIRSANERENKTSMLDVVHEGKPVSSPQFDDYLDLDPEAPKSVRQKPTDDVKPVDNIGNSQFHDYSEPEEASYWSSPIRDYTTVAKSYQSRKPTTCRKLTWHSKAPQGSDEALENDEDSSPLSSKQQHFHKESIAMSGGQSSPLHEHPTHEEQDSPCSEPSLEGRLRWKSKSASEDSNSVEGAPISLHYNNDHRRTFKQDGTPRATKLEYQVSNVSSYCSSWKSVRSTIRKQSPSVDSPTSVYDNIYSPLGGR